MKINVSFTPFCPKHLKCCRAVAMSNVSSWKSHLWAVAQTNNYGNRPVRRCQSNIIANKLVMVILAQLTAAATAASKWVSGLSESIVLPLDLSEAKLNTLHCLAVCVGVCACVCVCFTVCILAICVSRCTTAKQAVSQVWVKTNCGICQPT